MREEGKARGDGPPTGVCVSVADGRDAVASTSDHGPHFRRRHGSRFRLIFPKKLFFIRFAPQLDEINQLFLPNMRNKLLWFYQEVDEPEPPPANDQPKPGPSRTTVSNASKTPQGWFEVPPKLSRESSLLPFPIRNDLCQSGLQEETFSDGWLDLCLHRRVHLHLPHKHKQTVAGGRFPKGFVSWQYRLKAQK